MGFLYRLDFASGKSYVGITTRSPQKRLLVHRHWAKHGKRRALYNAWRKHGEPNLVVLARVENHKLIESEQRAILTFGTLVPNGYNMTPGGQLSPTSDPKVRAKISVSLTGHPVSVETRAKLRAAHLGRKQTEAMRAKLRGLIISDKTRAKMSAAAKARWVTGRNTNFHWQKKRDHEIDNRTSRK